MATTLIKNGKVISTTGVIAQDVLITDQTITALGAPGYSRHPITFSAPSAGETASTAAIQWTASGYWGYPAQSWGVWDAATGGALLWTHSFGGPYLTPGDTLRFEIGAVVAACI